MFWKKKKLVNKLILKFYFFLFIVRFYNDLNNMAAHVLFDAIDTSNDYHLRIKIRYLNKNRITDMALWSKKCPLPKVCHPCPLVIPAPLVKFQHCVYLNFLCLFKDFCLRHWDQGRRNNQRAGWHTLGKGHFFDQSAISVIQFLFR